MLESSINLVKVEQLWLMAKLMWHVKKPEALIKKIITKWVPCLVKCFLYLNEWCKWLPTMIVSSYHLRNIPCHIKYNTIVVSIPFKAYWHILFLLFSLSQGKYVTSRNLRDRLYRELERNLAMKVEDGETADMFLVSGRGTLHLTILIENM